jgi:hypothetical protein
VDTNFKHRVQQQNGNPGVGHYVISERDERRIILRALNVQDGHLRGVRERWRRLGTTPAGINVSGWRLCHNGIQLLYFVAILFVFVLLGVTAIYIFILLHQY